MPETTVDDFGAFNISLINDLPLFIDPFLLFHSKKPDYNKLHEAIIEYLVFLRKQAHRAKADEGLLKSWYCFKEVKQNWLGFSLSGNDGSGLGLDFARALCANLEKLFRDFGKEKITASSHLEKVCLIADKVGRDNISDFTTNLIKDYLCLYTEEFAEIHLTSEQTKKVAVPRAIFNYQTETWESKTYRLPWMNNDYIILTPRDVLTKDDNWINKDDLVEGFEDIPNAISDSELRSQVSNYFRKILVKRENKEPSKKEKEDAAIDTMRQFPILIDYYIWLKEQRGDQAESLSSERVSFAKFFFNRQLAELQSMLKSETLFYQTGLDTYEETHQRLAYLKHVIEHKGGQRIFYHDGKPIKREKDLQVLCQLVWFGSPSDVGAEVNDGRGPVDFKISRGAEDKTLIETKLASNKALERNLKKQIEIYQKASGARKAIKVIMFFSADEEERVATILNRLGLSSNRDVVLIDARNDNKPSGSIA